MPDLVDDKADKPGILDIHGIAAGVIRRTWNFVVPEGLVVPLVGRDRVAHQLEEVLLEIEANLRPTEKLAIDITRGKGCRFQGDVL